MERWVLSARTVMWLGVWVFCAMQSLWPLILSVRIGLDFSLKHRTNHRHFFDSLLFLYFFIFWRKFTSESCIRKSSLRWQFDFFPKVRSRGEKILRSKNVIYCVKKFSLFVILVRFRSNWNEVIVFYLSPLTTMLFQ